LASTRTAAVLAATSLAIACATTPPHSEMVEHDTRADELRIAVMRGDVASARNAAEWMFEHEEQEDFPAWASTFLVDFRQDARVLADADSPADAAMGTGRLLEACGACHAAVPGGPTIVMEEAAPGTYDTGSHMIRHFWATEKMAAGLVGPSEDAWTQGLEALADMPLDPAEMDLAASRQDEAGQLGVRLHAMAAQAQNLTTWNDRAEAYGRITYQCAACHLLRGR
jgi:cytochrome c2